MQAFIQVNIEKETTFSYQRPLLTWLKARNPEIVVLDLDSFSDEMLVTQAGNLMLEAEKYAVYFKLTEPDTNMGAAFKLLEEIIREEKPGLILIEGTHTRLTNIVQARSQLQLQLVDSPEAVKPFLQNYFTRKDHAD